MRPGQSLPSATAVIVAAGMGTRMGPGIDKIFLDLGGKPVVAWSWSTFDSSPCISDIVLVVRDGMQDHFHEIATSLNLTKPWTLVPGGKERQDSVWNGLNALPDSSRLVAIHDGARPCVTLGIIQKTLEAADSCGAAVAAQMVTDTIKSTDDSVFISHHLDRSILRSVQTPQCFHVSVIKSAFQAAISAGRSITDDTAACADIGQKVQLVVSSYPNIKITHPSDVPIARQILLADEK